jgi:protein-tyrosine phosphatase
VADDRWQMLREGAVSADLVERQTVCLIVFVCTGNTCRSPLAEGLCKKRLSDRLGCPPEELPQRGYVVLSAGLAVYEGGPAAAEAVAVAQTYGVDLSAHRSRGITAELLFQADHIVGVTRDHVETLEEASAGLTAAPRLLSPEGEDLADPVGHDRAVYETCAAAVWRHVDAFTAEILGPSPSGADEPIK